MKVLVTGGAGYIGSHTVLSLLNQGLEVVVLDNMTNSNEESLRRVATLTNKQAELIKGDILDTELLKTVFNAHQIDSVIHFAALKAVGESAVIPLKYYENNVYGTLNLLKVMMEFGVYNFVFSSSATIYGEEAEVPYIESMKLGQPSSPYGASKVMIEIVLADLANAEPSFRGVSLRYFNPIGAHESGQIGEDPKGIPNNLLPYIAQVAVGRRDKLSVFGDDYETPDGSCLRDYLHVMDLAEGHVAAIDWLKNNKDFRGIESFNLGSGNGISVLEIITAFERVTGKKVPYEVSPRRAGDLPAFWANADKANRELGWQCKRNLEQMLADTWNWQSNYPNGYEG